MASALGKSHECHWCCKAALIRLVPLDHTPGKTFAAVAAGGIVLMMKIFRQNEQVDEQLTLLACLSKFAFL